MPMAPSRGFSTTARRPRLVDFGVCCKGYVALERKLSHQVLSNSISSDVVATTGDTHRSNLNRQFRSRKFHTSQRLWEQIGGAHGQLSLSGARSKQGSISVRRFSTAGTRWSAFEQASVEESPIPFPITGGNIRGRLQSWQAAEDARSGRSDRAGALQDIISGTGDPKRVENEINDEEYMDEAELDYFDTRSRPHAISPILVKGDLVDLSIGYTSIPAFFVRAFDSQAQFYTIHGRWVHTQMKKASFSVSGLIDPSKINVLTPFLPQSELPEKCLDQLYGLDNAVPRVAAANIVSTMKDFEAKVNKQYREHASRFDRAHELMAHEKEIRHMSLNDISRIIYELPVDAPLTQPMLFAAHRTLSRRDGGFSIIGRVEPHIEMWEVLSRRDLKLTMQVRIWAREYQEAAVKAVKRPSAKQKTTVLGEFASKARRMILESRKHRPIIEGFVGPSKEKVEPFEFKGPHGQTYMSVVRQVPGDFPRFSPEDVDMIRFVEFWSAIRSSGVSLACRSIGPVILRAVGLYDGHVLDEAAGYLFLQELTVIYPWQNQTIFNNSLGLPGHHHDLPIDRLQAEAAEALKGWTAIDKMRRHARKDWADLKVFCVDRVDAAEIDDGVSLEEVDADGEQKLSWVHVHVANPTAFLSPDHPASRYAQELTETLYIPDKNYYMLSPHMVRPHFSLAPNRPVLTFSALLNEDGEMLEYKITPGIIRNVVFVTPDTVATALDPEGAKLIQYTRLQVGPDLQMKHQRKKGMAVTLSEIEKTTIRRLSELGEARARFREKKGAISVPSLDFDTKVDYVRPTNPNHKCYRRVEGDPAIRADIQEFDPIPSRRVQEYKKKTELIGNLMIIACEVAGHWCNDRNIPVMYRSTVENPNFPKRNMKEDIHSLKQKYGIVPFAHIDQMLAAMGLAETTSYAMPHGIIGADAYVKVTSPLRRYGDMLAHWQIEAALIKEAETGNSLAYKNNAKENPRVISIDSTPHASDQSYLPFSRTDVEKLIPLIWTRERVISMAKKRANLHWLCQLLYRARNHAECKLPETYQLYTVSYHVGGYGVRNTQFFCVVKELNVRVVISDHDKAVKTQEGGMQKGDWWEAKLESVDCYHRVVEMKLIRLLRRDGETEDRPPSPELETVKDDVGTDLKVVNIGGET